jgi:hypothetical protein
MREPGEALPKELLPDFFVPAYFIIIKVLQLYSQVTC